MSLLLLLNERVGMAYNVIYTNNVAYFENYYKSRYPMTIQHIIFVIIITMPTLFT